MRKLPPARVSYRGDFLIPYYLYIMMGLSYLGHLKVLLMLINLLLVQFKIANIMHALDPFQSTCRPISHRNRWSFCIYMKPVWNFRSSTTTGVNSCRGDSCRHDILRWYHVNKGHKRQPEWTCAGTKVVPVSCKHPLRTDGYTSVKQQLMEKRWLVTDLTNNRNNKNITQYSWAILATVIILDGAEYMHLVKSS